MKDGLRVGDGVVIGPVGANFLVKHAQSIKCHIPTTIGKHLVKGDHMQVRVADRKKLREVHVMRTTKVFRGFMVEFGFCK